MYAALWRLLPGPLWLRLLIVVALAVGLFFLLMEVVFPWVGPMLPWTEVGIQGDVPAPSSTPVSPVAPVEPAAPAMPAPPAAPPFSPTSG